MSKRVLDTLPAITRYCSCFGHRTYHYELLVLFFCQRTYYCVNLCCFHYRTHDFMYHYVLIILFLRTTYATNLYLVTDPTIHITDPLQSQTLPHGVTDLVLVTESTTKRN